MNTAALVLIWVAAVPATLVPILYGLAAPWWRSVFGRALLTSSTALALLLDLTLVFRIWHGHPRTQEVIALVVIGLIAVGAWLMLGTVLHTQLRRPRRRR